MTARPSVGGLRAPLQACRETLALVGSATRRVLLTYLVGSLLLAALEMVGVALVFPLLQATTGGEASLPLLGPVGGGERGLLLLAVVVLSAFVLKSVVAVLVLHRSTRALLRQEAGFAARLLDGYLRAPQSFLVSRNTTESLSRLEVSTSVLFTHVLVAYITIATEAAVIAGITVVLVLLQPLPALSALVYFLVLALAYHSWSRRRSTWAGAQVHEGTQATYRSISDSLSAAKDIALRHRQQHYVMRLHELKLRMAHARLNVVLLSQLPRYYLELGLIVGIGLLSSVLLAGDSRQDALAAVGLFLAAGFRLLPSMQRLLVSLGVARAGQASVAALREDFRVLGVEPDAEPARPPAAGGAPEQTLPLRQRLQVDGITYRYPGAQEDVLSDVSFVVDRGTCVGIIGRSGSGKSTLLDVLMGLLEQSSGSVLVDGRDVREQRVPWQRSVGYVPQSVHLFDDTLRANIALGVNPAEVDDEALRQAVQRAQLEPVVTALTEGLDTQVGERGARFSGGQRQRIGLARALYVRPEVLVLDEATSALDVETEHLVTETLQALRGSVTVLLVTHRLHTAQLCDRLVYLEAGRVAAYGDPEQLRRDVPQIAELARLSMLKALPGPAER